MTIHMVVADENEITLGSPLRLMEVTAQGLPRATLVAGDTLSVGHPNNKNSKAEVQSVAGDKVTLKLPSGILWTMTRRANGERSVETNTPGLNFQDWIVRSIERSQN